MLCLSGFELYYRWLPPDSPESGFLFWIYENVLCCFHFFNLSLRRDNPSHFTRYNLSVLSLCVSERPERKIEPDFFVCLAPFKFNL